MYIFRTDSTSDEAERVQLKTPPRTMYETYQLPMYSRVLWQYPHLQALSNPPPQPVTLQLSVFYPSHKPNTLYIIITTRMYIVQRNKHPAIHNSTCILY